jgi:uncharacterized protein (DUF1330 family)
MPAYFICTMSIHDPETYRKYTALTPATVNRYGGKFLTRGEEVLTVEGEKFADRLVPKQLLGMTMRITKVLRRFVVQLLRGA